jgi:hypothetical protein
MWEESVGEIPDGLTLDHICLNRACIGVWHLDLVEWSENSKRRWAGKRKSADPRTSSS